MQFLNETISKNKIIKPFFFHHVEKQTLNIPYNLVYIVLWQIHLNRKLCTVKQPPLRELSDTTMSQRRVKKDR